MAVWTKHSMARGTLWFRTEGPVQESVALGELDETSTAILTQELERTHTEHGWCAAFHDWEQSTGYTTRMRVDWIRWATTPAARAARFTHFRLGNSPLLHMAVSVASVAFSPQPFVVHKTALAYAAARKEYLSRPERIPELGSRRI
jgi:hypothetical protein